LGHHDIGYIDRPFDLPHSLDRINGYKNALEQNKIEYRNDLVIRGGFNYEGGAKAMEILLGNKNPPSAVVAFNDIAAIGAMRYIKDKGLNIPNDISVVGFDDIFVSAFTIPRLTTVHFPKYRMAESAYNLLIKRINGSISEPMKEVMLTLNLVIRESVSKH
jgi:DNA-binding LacI/PurR family transcriptional regulator